MIKLLTVLGARPQIIKAAAISRAIRNSFAGSVQEKILHTGQHYDANMSEVFFSELGIPQPDYNLNVGSDTHGRQTAKMIEGIEAVLQSDDFDGVILYGDTNSTLAGAVAASKLRIPVFHIEAGLRSFNMSMPEEINRIVCDSVSSILFPPTETAVKNLNDEGYFGSRAQFAGKKGRMVVNCGDVMLDNSTYFSTLSATKTDIIERNNLKRENFILATIHRDSNTDVPSRLEAIFSALMDVSLKYSLEVVLPLHPRTSKLMKSNLSAELYDKVTSSELFKIIPPASFFEIIELEKNAKIVMTDSGGVQKEAFFFEKPCVILRPETEWVEIVDNGAGIIADADYKRIVSGAEKMLGTRFAFPKLFGDGRASVKIIETIVNYLK